MDKVPAAMSNEELENTQIALRKEMIDIRTSIDVYETTKNHLNEDDAEDKKWLRKARYALRIKGHQHCLVLKEIGARNKLVRLRNRKFGDYFMNVAEASLEKSVFDKLRSDADKLRKEYQAKNPTPGLIKVDY